MKDLKIGNWVEVYNPFHPEYKHYIKVESINMDGIELCSSCEYDGSSTIESNPCFNLISITPEILDSCLQLEKWCDGKTWSYEKNGNVIQWRNNEIYLGGSGSVTEGQGFHTEGKYLHQLQNAFILTGEELEINDFPKNKVIVTEQLFKEIPDNPQVFINN